MGRYLIIDSETKTHRLFEEAVSSIDTQPQFVFADSVKNQLKLVADLSEEDQKNFWTFDLISVEFGEFTFNEWPDVINLLRGKNLKENFALLMTAHDSSEEHNPKKWATLDIYNLIFKPIDSLILKETVNLSLKISKRGTLLDVKSQQATAFVGILKEVELQSISELGFVTLSDSQIPENSVVKYFSSIFLNGKKQSVWAQCLISLPHPQKQGFFINKFQYYGAEPTFLATIRKYVLAQKQHHEMPAALWNMSNPKTITPLKMALVALDNADTQNLAAAITNHYHNLNAEIVKLDPKNKTSGQLFDHQIVLNLTDLNFDTIKPFFDSKTVFFLMSQSLNLSLQKEEDDMRTYASQYKDLFIQPFDRSYFYKKLKVHFPLLISKDELQLINVGSQAKMKATQSVKISEISELFVNFMYYRQLNYKDFREFAFMNDDESQLVELPAFCHFSEKTSGSSPQDKNVFAHQFVFFGMSDHYLKQIRIWLLQNYISTNKKE